MKPEFTRMYYGDPARVYERIEAQEQAKAVRAPESKQERALRKLKELFKEAPSVEDNE